jgi:putative flippase GtrA
MADGTSILTKLSLACFVAPNYHLSGIAHTCLERENGEYLPGATMILDMKEPPPGGFKILKRHGLPVQEWPFTFGQLTGVRFYRMFRFAAVGAFGTLLNLTIMTLTLDLGGHYLLAAIVATELTILSNFLMQERLVFLDMRGSRPFWQRILASFGFNNLEALVRIPVLVFLVEALFIPSVLAQAVTLAVAFLARFAFTSLVIYRVRPSASVPAVVPGTSIAPTGVETA